LQVDTKLKTLQKQRITYFILVFYRPLNKYCRNVQPSQDGVGSGKFRRELRARLCCALFNAIPNIKAHQRSNRTNTRASLIAFIHESSSEQAHRRCKSAKFLRYLPRPTSSEDDLQFGICNLHVDGKKGTNRFLQAAKQPLP